VTPGIDLTREKLPFLGLPDDMCGKRVLDVGCWGGFFAFLAEQRGAEVAAADVFKTRGFEFARSLLIESAIAGTKDQPTMQFCEEDECLGDPTVWWIPTVDCSVRTVRAAGFPKMDVVNIWGGNGRAVVHAWKTPGMACEAISEDIYTGIDSPTPGATLRGEFAIQGWT
jgi:SAM-dependent methyltransferase